MRATIRPDFFLQEIAGDKILLGGGEQINFSKVLMLNNTSAFIIEELQRAGGAVAAEDMARRVAGRFEVDATEAQADVEEFFRSLARQQVADLSD